MISLISLEQQLEGLDFEGVQIELQRIVSDSQARTRIFHQVSFVSGGDFGVQFDTLRTSLRRADRLSRRLLRRVDAIAGLRAMSASLKLNRVVEQIDN